MEMEGHNNQQYDTMSNRYQQEIQNFETIFASFKDKKMVLYGIGRYTATLVDGIRDFQIIGLLDRDPSNRGKTFFGLPVLSKAEVQEKADLIVINTAGTYWSLIYGRIKDWGIPVYYRNGEIAKENNEFNSNDSYWYRSIDELRGEIEKADIVSFDFYGTLFLRKVCSPKDVFHFAERIYLHRYRASESYTSDGKSVIEVKNSITDSVIPVFSAHKFGNSGEKSLSIEEGDISFSEIRSRAITELPDIYTLDELYQKIQEIGGWTQAQADNMRQIELDLEKKLLAPRTVILNLIKEAQEFGKQIYVVSDMYLPGSFFIESLSQQGISIDSSHIWVSGEKKADKSSGKLWDLFCKEIVKNKETALHIGDDQNADIEKAEERGIRTYYVSDSIPLLSLSSLAGIESHACSITSSLILGLFTSRLLQDPYIFASARGRVEINDLHTMGYCVFGPVILSFFQWMDLQIEEDNIDRVLFMARDGYFLHEDYLYYQSFQKDRNIKTDYIGISRQVAMMSAIETEDDLREYIKMPYSGTVSELIEDRFGISGVEADSQEDIKKYLPEIYGRVKVVSKNYRNYVDSFNLSQKDAVVDLGFYGNNQRYLSKLTGVPIAGYYFNGNVTEDNPNAKVQKMKVCFQEDDDPIGVKSQILKYQIFLESFLTAPYGMITDIQEDGKFACKPDGNNQRYFEDKREINEGVKAFISEFCTITENVEIEMDTGFADNLYGKCMDGSISFSNIVKKSFYNDNAMMNRQDSAIFY